MVALIDDEDLEEIVLEVAFLAQEIDEVANRQVLGHRDEIAAHQAPGGFLGVSERARYRLAGFGLEFGDNRALVGLVQVLDQLHRIIGVELFGDGGDRLRGQGLHQVFADVIVQFGDHVTGHQIGDRGGQLRAFGAAEQFDQVGNVGGVERLD